MKMPATILHADMDAFYAAVEQRDRPELRGKPVVVGGASDRGVVSAASYEARRYGIHSAMPSALARRLCPEAVFLRGDMSRYARESKRIFQLFREFTPRVEGLSIDEAFLELTGSERLLGPAAEVGERLRARIRRETELAVSVGIGPIKMVAKLASGLAKPDGLLEVPRDGVRDFLDPLAVRRLWGVGPVGECRLQRAGFERIGDLARASSRRLEEALGPWGLEIARLARGEDLREVEPYREAVSYSEENTFASDVSSRAQLEATISTHAEAVARRLRRDGVRARTVVLKLRMARRRAPGSRGYPLLTRRCTLPEACDDGPTLAREARRLLERFGLREAVRLLGVGVTNLESGRDSQLDLFGASAEVEQRGRINKALDDITERFGSRAIVRGGPDAVRRAGLSMQIKRGETREPER